MIIDVVKVFLPAAVAFFIGILITPILTHYLYKFKAWKKMSVQETVDGLDSPITRALHQDETKKTPRMGGIIIWGSALITTLLIFFISKLFPVEVTQKLDFFSRNQTWIPFFALLVGAGVGLIDDIYEVSERGSRRAGGLSLTFRLSIVGAVALFIGGWFYFKLDVVSLGIPFYGDFFIGPLIIPAFILVALALYASGIIDGIDGLSGGVFAAIFTAYAAIAFYQQQIDLAAFSAMLVGSILAFLWFNIPPARFYMSETGTMGLTLTVAVLAFMTDSLGGGIGVFVLPIIALPLVVTVLSVIIQVLSKKFRGGKTVFLVSPLHNHFQALGWPGYKVTMRYWIISMIFAILGVIVALIG